MKTGSVATKLLLAALLLTVVIYFGVNVAAYLMDPFTTTIAYSFTSDHAVTVSGYVVRSETVLAGGGDLIYVSRSEGEKVSKNGTVAHIYSDAKALEEANSLRSLTEQLEQLSYARSLVSSAQSALRLDEEVAQALVDFRAEMAGGDVDRAREAGAAVRAAVLKRSYAYSGTSELDGDIIQLQNRIAALSASSSSGTTRVTAPVGGLFSGLVDGYESVLSPDMLMDMTPGDYRAISAGSQEGVGKIITGNKWYYIALMRESDMGHMRAGDTVTLRFQSGLDRDLSMTVERISDEDAGQRLVVLSSEKHLNLTTLLRHQNAQIIFDSFQGIRVPRSAVRILWKDVLDEDGNVVLNSDWTAKQEQVTGVYCLWGTTARFKPVDILWQEEEYLLVTASEEDLTAYTTATAREGRRLRAGDEVIIAAQELYDGKVIA